MPLRLDVAYSLIALLVLAAIQIGLDHVEFVEVGGEGAG